MPDSSWHHILPTIYTDGWHLDHAGKATFRQQMNPDSLKHMQTSMKSRRHTALLLTFLACTRAVFAETLEVRMRIHQKAAEEKTINRENLTRIKQFILQNGQRETYCNAYNNNPSQHTKGFHFYLNPDTGQENINCDPTKSDFNSLTIRSAGGGKNQYRSVEFADKNYICITANHPTDDLTVSQVRQCVEDALQEILAAIEMKAPDRDAATVMPRIRKAIDVGPTFESLSGILGEPDLDIGSGIHIFVYRLSDGTGIRVGTPDKNAVSYVYQADNRLFPSEAGQAPGGQQPFDEVLWVERPKPEISMLYLVLTNTDGHDDRVRLVVSHAAAALREAEKHQGLKFHVVYFVRPSGMYTGFSVEQLQEIAAESPKRAEELVGQHTWGIGELPKPTAQGGAIRLKPESTAPTPRDIFPTRASGERSDPRH